MTNISNQLKKCKIPAGNDLDLLQYIVEQAKIHLEVDTIILFGSRARGDFNTRSDYDLAFNFPQYFRKNWALFRENIREHAPTLHSVDLVLMDDHLEPRLRASIEKEGIVIYDTK